jgi:hypothetical protein
VISFVKSHRPEVESDYEVFLLNERSLDVACRKAISPPQCDHCLVVLQTWMTNLTTLGKFLLCANGSIVPCAGTLASITLDLTQITRSEGGGGMPTSEKFANGIDHLGAR